MRVLLIGEFSGLQNEIKRALVLNGHSVTLAAGSDMWKKFPSDIVLAHGNNKYTYFLWSLILPWLNLYKFKGYDVVHLVNFYVFPRLAFLNLPFIYLLKKMNKVVSLSGAGDDPFFVKYSSHTLRYNPIEPFEKIDIKKKHFMRSAWHEFVMRLSMHYVDCVIPIMYEYYSTFLEAGYSEKLSKPIAIPIDCSLIEFKSFDINKHSLIFFHGLNRRGFKGTFIVEKSFEELSAKYKEHNFIIKGGLPFKEYMNLLQTVDVSIDQLFSYSLSMNALYSMAQGKVVLGGAEKESGILYQDNLPPVVNILPNNESVINEIEKLINNKNLLLDLSFKSRSFVEKFHNPKVIASKYEDVWNNLISKK